MIKHDSLAGLAGIEHAFCTREGGASTGIYASLNCGLGSGDDKSSVRENRRRVLAGIGLAADRLRTVYQVHGTTVWTIADDSGRVPKQADAMVTKMRGIGLGILTADCAPVLFADRAAGVVGAAHAGWKGAVSGVLAETIAAMEALGARRRDIAAAVGPCIGRKSYEVGPEFPRPFLDEDRANEAFFIEGRRDGRFQFDLAGYVAASLGRLGLVDVSATQADTCAEADRFFSYRRTCLRGEPDYGRQISVIALAPR